VGTNRSRDPRRLIARLSQSTQRIVATSEIDAVLFDFGGVLADGPWGAFERYESENGLTEGFIRSLNATNPETNAWARLERNEVGLEEFCELFEEEARAAGGSVDAKWLIASLAGAMRPTMIEAVRRCHEHFRTGLLTNNFVRIDGAERFEGMLEMFDTIVESAVEGVRKPDPRFYLIACERLGVEPQRCVFLDDLGVNLKPARALGMRTIKVADPTDALSELEGLLGIPFR
jgi:putative hydrolase of the HAD superfamily